VDATSPCRNWAGNVTFSAADCQRPSSVGQVQALVARAERVRALGTAHSFTEIADTPGLLLATTGLPAEIEVDSAAATVRVAAGVRYGELARRVDEHGFALPNLGSLPHLSVAGACATGTHGSGARGCLSTSVSGLEIVTAAGDLVRIGRDAPEDRLDGAAVHLGALGVVVSLTLDLVPAFRLRQRVFEDLPLDGLDDHLDELLSAAYSVSLFTDWRAPRLTQVWLKEQVAGADPAVLGEPWFTATPADRPRHPMATMPADNCTEQLGVPGRWFERLPHFRADSPPSGSGDELQSEYLLPREHAAAALRAVDGVRNRVSRVVQTCEIRVVAADELWMSPCHRRDTVAVHFTWVRDLPAVLPVVALVEDRLAPFEPRPHWGKISTIRPEVVRDRYPRLPDFRELVRAYDPRGKFGNAYLERYLGVP
jgi:alditol oxidase